MGSVPSRWQADQHRLTHRQQRKCSHTHTPMPLRRHRNAQGRGHETRTSMHYPPKMQLPKLSVNRSHRCSLHVALRGSRSVGGFRASERGRSDDGGACEMRLRSS